MKLGYVYKKKSLHASERERPRCSEEADSLAPLNIPVNTTILSSIRLDGTCVYTVYQGGTTAERFQQYLEVNLLPTLGLDDIVIMDNMRSHHAVQ